MANYGPSAKLDVVGGPGANLSILESGVVLLTGVSGDNFSTPDTPGNSITGDIDIRVKVALSDWTPTTDNTLIGKGVSGGQRSVWIEISTDAGKPRVGHSPDGMGGNQILRVATVVTGFTHGNVHWLRGRLAVDVGARHLVLPCL